MEGWEEVQRHGQDMVDRVATITQGIGCILQSHIKLSNMPSIPSFYPSELIAFDIPWNDEAFSFLTTSWPLAQLRTNKRRKFCVNRVQFNGIYKASFGRDNSMKRRREEHVCNDDYDRRGGIQELSDRLGQVGASVGSFVGGFIHQTVSHFPWTFHRDEDTTKSDLIQPQPMEYDSGLGSSVDGSLKKGRTHLDKDSNASDAIMTVNEGLEYISNLDEEDFEDDSNANQELLTALNNHPHIRRQQRSINVTATFDSQTQETESSFVARGDLWRVEVSHGSNTTARPPFLLQIGPILLVRDTTLLLPIHISKQHLLWYGFDRKNAVHSLCPAVWSKHRQWLLMSMICVNPFTCSFLDFQSPNGQLTYIAGEGLSIGGYFPLCGGIFQAQGRCPGDMKLSFSKKVGCGTRITPVLHFPEKSVSLNVVQQLAWQRSGAIVRPMVELSIMPTVGGRNAGWRAELMHLPREKIGLACGFASTIQPTVFASLMVGRSKQNENHSGNSGLQLQVEAPISNLTRASFSIQLVSGIEF